jgi:hypothetical protein
MKYKSTGGFSICQGEKAFKANLILRLSKNKGEQANMARQ